MNGAEVVATVFGVLAGIGWYCAITCDQWWRRRCNEAVRSHNADLKQWNDEIADYRGRLESARLDKERAVAELAETEAVLARSRHQVETLAGDVLRATRGQEAAEARVAAMAEQNRADREQHAADIRQRKEAAERQMGNLEERHTAQVDRLTARVEELDRANKDADEVIAGCKRERDAARAASEQLVAEQTACTLQLQQTRDGLEQVRRLHAEAERERDSARRSAKTAADAVTDLLRHRDRLHQILERLTGRWNDADSGPYPDDLIMVLAMTGRNRSGEGDFITLGRIRNAIKETA